SHHMRNEDKCSQIVDVINSEFDKIKSRNSSYSLRYFAKYLDTDASNLSKIMNGQMQPGSRLAHRLSRKLGIQSKDLLESLSFQKSEDSAYKEHVLEVFKIISDWYHYAILELLKTTKFVDNQARPEMAKSLNISVEELNTALQRLMSAGLLKFDSNKNKIVLCDESSSSILHYETSEAHRNHQRQILEMGIDALEKYPIEKRSQSSMTLAIDKSKLEKAKKMIKEFRRKLSRFLSESSHLDDVYHLSISLYPISQNDIKENKL
ncbi:MAG: DUF4423 domain-containing protein, partial [Bdellovibrionales bacterium]|nr:DUF4423 domain-containing protein [Bdellovibrionales bacterium]